MENKTIDVRVSSDMFWFQLGIELRSWCTGNETFYWGHRQKHKVLCHLLSKCRSVPQKTQKFNDHPFVVTSVKSKVQQQPSNVYTFCCTASELLLLNIRAFGEKCRLPRMLYQFNVGYIMFWFHNVLISIVRGFTCFIACFFAGLPNTFGEYDETPELMASHLKVESKIDKLLMHIQEKGKKCLICKSKVLNWNMWWNKGIF